MFFSGVLSDVTDQRVYLRGGYVTDLVFHMRFDDEFPTIDSSSAKISMTNYSSLISLNLYKKVDLYTLLGTMQLTIKDTMFFRRKYMWAIGAKGILYENNFLCLGADVKYLYSKQKALFLLYDNLPATLLTDFLLGYQEVQGSVSFAYKWRYFSPYVGGAYLYAKGMPDSPVGFFNLSAWDMDFEFPAVNIVNRKRWGLYAGFTIFSKEAASINVEGRLYDQYSVNVQGEIAF
jgi:hypothetical protein